MAIDLKTETPDTTINDSALLFGADSQASANPSVYAVSTLRNHIIGTTNTFTATQTFTPVVNTSALVGSGYSLTGSASASFMDLAGTWNTSGTPTAIKVNITDTASNASSLLMDLQVGGVSQFRVRRDGRISNGTANDPGILLSNTGNGRLEFQRGNTIRSIVGTDGIFVTNQTGFFWANSSFDANATVDLFLTRKGAGNLRLGAADAATPVAQTLSVQGRTGTDAAATAYPFTIQGAQGTGTGAGGSIVFQVAPAGTAGSTPNGFATALTIASDRTFIFNYAANEVFKINAVSGSLSGNSANTFGTVFINGDQAAGAACNVSLGGSSGEGVTVRAGGFFAFSAATNSALHAQRDTILARDAANTLALRNGANQQIFNIYSTFTDTGNYSRLGIGLLDGGGNIYLRSEGAGATGVARGINIRANSGKSVVLSMGAIDIFNFSAAGLQFGIDNTYDIGASGATRPRSIYIGTEARISSSTAIDSNGPQLDSSKFFRWSSSVVGGATDVVIGRGGAAGTIVLGNKVAYDDFSRLMFGGTTSSFPALKRDTTTLQARLADDSAFATIQGKLRADVNAVAETPTATHTITITDAAGTAYKVLCVAA